MKPGLRHRQQGSAVIVVLALLAILFAYVSFNAVTLHRLSREVKAVEKRQVSRLELTRPAPAATGQTNAAPTSPRLAPGGSSDDPRPAP